jgi:hypothetical protein
MKIAMPASGIAGVLHVIAGSEADEAIQRPNMERWIASLRSQ